MVGQRALGRRENLCGGRSRARTAGCLGCRPRARRLRLAPLAAAWADTTTSSDAHQSWCEPHRMSAGNSRLTRHRTTKFGTFPLRAVCSQRSPDTLTSRSRRRRTRWCDGRAVELIRYTSVWRNFDAACRRLGPVRVTPHSLRASCAFCVAESVGLLEAARRLGHSRSSVTTRHYARPMTRGDAVVAERRDAARTGVRMTVFEPVGPPEWARRGRDGRSPGEEVGGGEAHPR